MHHEQWCSIGNFFHLWTRVQLVTRDSPRSAAHSVESQVSEWIQAPRKSGPALMIELRRLQRSFGLR
eukprot:1608-Hanusia_phi.AAC.1